MLGRRERSLLAVPATVLSSIAIAVELWSTVPRWILVVLLGGTVVWTAFAIGWITRSWSRAGSRELSDPDFLLKLLDDGMPPTFVKRWDAKEKRGHHIFENTAFDRVQNINDTVPVSEKRREVIHADHRKGDLEAIEQGRSVQLELCDRAAGEAERHILTMKTAVKHRGKQYVVGWFVPVSFEGSPVKAPGPDGTVRLRQYGFQVVFRLAQSLQDARIVPVGKAILDAAETPASTGAARR